MRISKGVTLTILSLYEVKSVKQECSHNPECPHQCVRHSLCRRGRLMISPMSLQRSTCQHTWAPQHSQASFADCTTSVYRHQTWKSHTGPHQESSAGSGKSPKPAASLTGQNWLSLTMNETSKEVNGSICLGMKQKRWITGESGSTE